MPDLTGGASCGRRLDPHPSHKYMRARTVYVCPGEQPADRDLGDRLTAVRDLHRDAYAGTAEAGSSCTAGCGTWPCATVRALDGPEPADDVTLQDVERAVLRDRIRQAICEASGFEWAPEWQDPDEYGEVADAVLAVLPAPADRAAVLREAADAIDFEWGGPDHDDAWTAARDKFRRMADEAQQAGRCCGECGHDRSVHSSGDDPVSPGRCADCGEDDAWHDYTTEEGR